MDYGDVIVHVFAQDTREFYDLERLWANTPKIDVTPETVGATPHRGASVG
jgi:ribosomal silencing factor RsfS